MLAAVVFVGLAQGLVSVRLLVLLVQARQLASKPIRVTKYFICVTLTKLLKRLPAPKTKLNCRAVCWAYKSICKNVSTNC